MALESNRAYSDNRLLKEIYSNLAGEDPAIDITRSVSTNKLLKAIYLIYAGETPQLDTSTAISNNKLLAAIYSLMQGAEPLDANRAYSDNQIYRKIFSLQNDGSVELDTTRALSINKLLQALNLVWDGSDLIHASLPTFSLLSSGTITDTGATVSGTVNPGGAETVWSIEYGETTAYGSTETGGTITEETAISKALTGLTPYTLYHWRIKAVNSAGTAYSDDQTLTTTTAQFPSNLTSSAISESQINLAWTIGTTGHDGHRIYMSTDNILFTEKGTVSGATATYNATGLTADTRYYFKVVAFKGSLESAATTVKSAFTSLMFVMRFDTTKAGSAADTVVIPVTGSGYNCTVYWGDGTSNNYSGSAPTITHTYSVQGIYTIKISGTFPRIYFNATGDRLKLIEIINWGNRAWADNSDYSFSGCNNVTCSATDIPNTSAVTEAIGCFTNCWLFDSYSIAEADWRNLIYSATMFSNARVFNQSLNKYGMPKLSVANGMFASAWKYNQAISWTSKLTRTDNMFNLAYSFNQNLSGLDFSLTTNFSTMFSGSLSTSNYDALLISLAAQNVQTGRTLNVGDTKYSSLSAAARLILTTSTAEGGKGWTITDGGLISTSKFNKGKLLITWDDIYTEQYTNGLPIFNTEGVKSTHYVVSGWVGTANRLTWAQIQEMHAAGHDIECHTSDHTVLTTLNQAQIESNLTAVNNAFIAHSLPTPRHIAYPIGTYNANVKLWVASLRDTGRDDEMIDTYGVYPNTDKYALSTHIMDNLTEVNYAILLNRIERAADAKTAYIVCGHGLNATGDTYSTKIAHLQGIIDKAQELGMDIITMSQLYSLMT